MHFAIKVLSAVVLSMAALPAQKGTMNIKDDAQNVLVVAASTTDRSFSISLRAGSPDTELEVRIKNSSGVQVGLVTLNGEGDGTGVLNLKAGEYIEATDVDSPQNNDLVKIEYDVK